MAHDHHPRRHRDSGRTFAVVAMDQRGTCRRMYAAVGQPDVTAAEMTALKADILDGVREPPRRPSSSTRTTGCPRCAVSRPARTSGPSSPPSPRTGGSTRASPSSPVTPADRTVGPGAGRRRREVPHPGPRRPAGGRRRPRPHRRGRARPCAAVVEDCADAGIPSVIENLIYPLNGEGELTHRTSAPTPSSRRPCGSTRSAPRCSSWSTRGPPEACRRLAGRLTRPWAVLSAGVPMDRFSEVLRVSCDEGGASGFIAGRAIWKDAVGMPAGTRSGRPSRRRGAPAARRGLAAIDGRARPWQRGGVMTACSRLAGLSRSFGHVQALDNADFEVVVRRGRRAHRRQRRRQVDDGQGPDRQPRRRQRRGSLRGREGSFSTASGRVQRGIEVVHQDLALAPHLDPTQNMFLGREIMRSGLGGPAGIHERAARCARMPGRLRRAGVGRPVGHHARRGHVRWAASRAWRSREPYAWASKVLFLDEPTAALGVIQTRNVLDMIRRVRDKGVAVVLISHSMPHVLAVADRIQVLRLGKRVMTIPAEGTTVEQLVGAMTGALDEQDMERSETA